MIYEHNKIMHRFIFGGYMREKLGKIREHKKLIIILKIVFILVAALGFSALKQYNSARTWRSLDPSEQGVMDIDFNSDDISYSGFELQDGKLVMTSSKASITICKSMSLLNKLSYDYDLHKDFNVTVNNVYADTPENGEFVSQYTDSNNYAMSKSVINVGSSVVRIEMFFDKDAKGIAIENFIYDNRAAINWRVAIRDFIIVMVILSLILFYKIFVKKLEYGFAFTALCLGMVIIISMPTLKVSWDEAYHFNGAYNLSWTGKVVSTPMLENYLKDIEIRDIYYPRTYEEYTSMNEYINEHMDYTVDAPDAIITSSKLDKISDIGHIASAIGINIAKTIHLPFTAVYMLGKIFNLLLYVGITFLAIRHTKVGKRIMTLIALMPTPLFLAVSYSYDATLNAFMFLGLSYIISEFVDSETKMSKKSYIIFMVSMFVVCSIKMIYVPMILILILLPKKKFKDNKTMWLVKSGVFVLCIALVAFMTLPTLLNPPVVGDTRGGDTSTAGQIDYIFTHIITYARLLISSIKTSFVDYMLDVSGLGTFGHMVSFQLPGVIALILLAVGITDTNEYTLKPYVKIVTAGLVFSVMCLIWTAMYLSFTPVGYGEITGVQGRYYIPLLLPLMYILNTNKIKNNLNQTVYNILVLIAPIIIVGNVILGYLSYYCS